SCGLAIPEIHKMTSQLNEHPSGGRNSIRIHLPSAGAEHQRTDDRHRRRRTAGLSYSLLHQTLRHVRVSPPSQLQMALLPQAHRLKMRMTEQQSLHWVQQLPLLSSFHPMPNWRWEVVESRHVQTKT